MQAWENFISYRCLYLQVVTCRKREMDASGRAVFKSQLPRIKQDGQTSDRDLLMLAIMSLWRIDLGFFFYGITEDQTRVFVREAGQMLLQKESTMLRMSGARTFGGLFAFALSFQPGDDCYEGGIYYLTAGMYVRKTHTFTTLLTLLAGRSRSPSPATCS